MAIRQLKKLGLRADAVANGREALEALARIPYDLVLMDCQMPEMDGYEATAEIRRREGTTKHTPIVAMTAHALAGDRANCIAAGMDDYISKPVKSEELERVLERLLFANEPVAADEPVPEETLPAPIDRERVFEALGEDPVEMLDLYLFDMDRNLEKLATAIEAGKADEINSLAHNCAGVSATCGIIAMVAPMRELERMGRENELEGAAALGLQMRATFARVKQFLLEEFEGLAVAAEEATPEETLPASIDRERVFEALGEDPSEMLGHYLSDMDRNLEKLAIAIEAGKADEINSIAHNCAGVSATCGIIAMVAPMRELERMGRENELEGAAALGLQMRATFARVKQFLLEEFEGLAVAAEEATPEETLPASIDRERVFEALGEDPSEMLGHYLNDMDRNLEKLAIAIEAGKADEINSIAHNCAGVSATCGIIAMVAPMRELERMGRENELEGAAALGLQTRATFARVKQFLEEEFEGVAVAV